MKLKVEKSINYYMRLLHRDIGFFIVGLTIIYSISGIVLIYQDTDLFKYNKLIEKKISTNIEENNLGWILQINDFKISKVEGNVVYFQNGTYNKTTGVVIYSRKELPSFLNKFRNLHKSSNRDLAHWFSTVFGILLFFMAISSFWMFNTKSKMFRRGIFIAGIGIVIAIVLLIV